MKTEEIRRVYLITDLEHVSLCSPNHSAVDPSRSGHILGF
jgi:hypothetical protein